MTTTEFQMTQAERDVNGIITMLVADEGMTITEATEHAIKALPNPRPEFVLAASGGTLALIGTQTYRVADLSV